MSANLLGSDDETSRFALIDHTMVVYSTGEHGGGGYHVSPTAAKEAGRERE